jgi:hypothetical protein
MGRRTKFLNEFSPNIDTISLSPNEGTEEGVGI